MDLNFSLHPSQLTIFKSNARFKVCAAGRRFGKSFLSAVTLIIEGLKDTNEEGYSLKNKDVWYIAPTFQQGKDIMWGLLKDLGRDVIESTVENTATIRLINGRQIKIKGSDRPDTLRGSGLGYVVLDEYADMKPQVWEEIIFPTLTDVEGGALFIGTPKGKNHFYDLYLAATEGEDAEWEGWHFNTVDNPLLNKELVAKARERLSTQAFRQEFEASFNATGGNIFKEDMIVLDENEPADGHYYIAVDPAGFGETKDLTQGRLKRLDETAIAIVKVHQGGWWVKNIDSGRWDVRETSIRILKHYKDVQAAAVGIENGSLKNALMPYMEDQMRRLGVYPRVEPLTHGGKKKTERITWALQGRFEHGRIKLNKGAYVRKFVEQLLDFPNPLAHDDLPDALAYIDQIAVTNYDLSFSEDEFEILDDIIGF